MVSYHRPPTTVESQNWNGMGVETKINMPGQMSERDELRQENARLRGDLLTVARRVSHDLRTPLGGVISAAEAMNEILAETDPSALPLVTSLLNSAEEISQLIKRISFVVKATASPPTPAPLSMGETVWVAMQHFERMVIANGATISEPETWPEAIGVGPWLEVIWWNLLGNALHYAGPQPKIELGWRQEGESLEFWVADNGPGVAAEKNKKLFHPFHRLHEPDAAHGFGLPIVQRLVELQGGTCGYRPGARGGAYFFFILPNKPFAN
jgi:signal transduction histidine kinase